MATYLEVYGWQAGSGRESSFPTWSGPEPKQTLCAKKDQRKSDPSYHGDKEADDLRVDKKRRAETEATINQRTFIMCKSLMMTGKKKNLKEAELQRLK